MPLPAFDAMAQLPGDQPLARVYASNAADER
jgi:hypothetical protein